MSSGQALRDDEREQGYILQKDGRGRFWRVGYDGGLWVKLEKDPTQEVYFEDFPVEALVELAEGEGET